MTSTWLESTFQMIGDRVIVYEDSTSWTDVDPNWLASQQPTSNPPTYAELSALEIASQGWQKVFDQWKEKGIVV